MTNRTREYPVKFNVRPALYAFGLDFCMYSKIPEGQTFVAETVNMKVVEQGSLVEPLFNLDSDEAQALMDAMWNVGVRPSNGEGNVGMIGAMKEHLASLKEDVAWHRGRK